MPIRSNLTGTRKVDIKTTLEGASTQRLQNPLIKEYTLNHIRDPIIIYGIFLNLGGLEALAKGTLNGAPLRKKAP